MPVPPQMHLAVADVNWIVVLIGWKGQSQPWNRQQQRPETDPLGSAPSWIASPGRGHWPERVAPDDQSAATLPGVAAVRFLSRINTDSNG